MFTFFLQSYRTGILTFSGSIIEVEFELDGDEGKYCFRKIENGEIKRNEVIKTRHPNIVFAVVTGKRSWGLWLDQWTDGIVDWTFTEEEILDEFHKRGIQIPKPLLLDFRNRIEKKKRIRNQKMFDMLDK